MELCVHGGGKTGAYGVAHYSRQACGAAFGPLGLTGVMRFCRGAEVVLSNQPSGVEVLVTTPPSDEEYRANACVLLGAYLVLKHEWSVDHLANAMGVKDANARFEVSWAPRRTPEKERVLRVRDCWAGVALAVQQGWLKRGFVDDDARTGVYCNRCETLLAGFDAAWIVPGSIMVAADPTTVTCDPNPATCSKLLPGETEEPARANSSSPKSLHSQITFTSVDTVCKEYGGDNVSNCASLDQDRPESFVDLYRQSSIGLVIRANFMIEQGMPNPSYPDRAFEPYGIDQVNIQVKDTDGGLPKSADVAKMLKVCEGYSGGSGSNAVLVHCKGGFGRSVMFACCLAIYRLNIPGEALLGWVRMARPGALTTRKQELFLVSLKGHADVAKYARLHTTCGVNCPVQ
uniref:Tyrosine specific protein phosphatases domain-containing protein n=1 Tax=Pyrodinium bahamense TaxID=73915 RepID=A0A7S0G134_9DINO